MSRVFSPVTSDVLSWWIKLRR